MAAPGALKQVSVPQERVGVHVRGEQRAVQPPRAPGRLIRRTPPGLVDEPLGDAGHDEEERERADDDEQGEDDEEGMTDEG